MNTTTMPPVRRLLIAAGLILASQALLASSASAQCAGGDCSEVTTLGQGLVQGRTDRTLSSTPTQDEINQRLNQGDWTASPNVPTPFSASSTGVSTSLNDWRASLTAAERKRLEEAQKRNPKLKMPAPIQHKPSPVNVWVNSSHQSLDSGVADTGGATTTYVGADYRVHSKGLVGAEVQVDDASQDLSTAGAAATGKAYMAGPYAAYKVNKNIVIDGKTTWGQSDDSARAGDTAADFSTARALSQARVSGDWGLRNNKWQLKPSGAITHISEDTQGDLAGSIENIDETKASVRPELHRPIQTNKGNKIDPYAYVQSSLNLDNPTFADATPQNSVGGGVSITTTKKYTFNANADYTTPSEDPTSPGGLSGHLQLNVPLGGSN